MATKKLINTVENCVDETLQGVVCINPGLQVLQGHRVVVRGDVNDVIGVGKVTLLCGGGSGHEPAHAGYIGPGMLSAAVAGAVFTSPPPSSILAALRTITKPGAASGPHGPFIIGGGENLLTVYSGRDHKPSTAGTVVIVTNYTGDRLNFGLAVERARQEGLHVDSVVIGEDCALNSSDKSAGRRGLTGTVILNKNYTGDRLNFGLAAERAKNEGLKVNMVVVGEDSALTSSDKTAGRRGLCGTVLMHKICGALAEQGKTLEEIMKIAQQATQNMGTIGVSLTPCSVPGAGPSFQLSSDEMELGLGIHGEAGVRRTKLVSAKEVVQMMIDHMTNTQTTTHIKLKKGDRVACMVNNLGGTSVLEMNIIAKEAIELLESRGVTVERAYCGSFMTSLEMAGVSITLLHLDDTLRNCLDADTSAPAWPKPLLPSGKSTRETPKAMPYDQIDTVIKSGSKVQVAKENADMIYEIIKLAMERLIAAEEKLNNLDKESGDGDCGSTVARGAKEILHRLGAKSNPGLPVQNPADLCLSLANIVENSMGGSSGAIYSLFFTSAALCLQSSASAESWMKALNSGNSTVMRYGGAEPGDRTMVDPLVAAGTTLQEKMTNLSPVQSLEAAVLAAEKAAEATAGMKAQAGRASYVSADRLKNPDPGAVSVTIWMKAILEVINKS